MNEKFYREFQNTFRGPYELIKNRLQIYSPVLKELNKLYPSGTAIDIGAGRGEWLDILEEHQFNAIGIDIECYSSNHNIIIEDFLEFSKKIPDNSVALVSAFHVVEHVRYDVFCDWLKEIYRILFSDGIVIIETPNPDNVMVGSSSFYLDPTHINPVPSPLLTFYCKYAGFKYVNSFFLPVDEFKYSKNIYPLDEIAKDYVVIAQKDFNEENNRLNFVNVFNDNCVKYNNINMAVKDEFTRVENDYKQKLIVLEDNYKQKLIVLEDKTKINYKHIQKMKKELLKLFDEHLKNQVNKVNESIQNINQNLDAIKIDLMTKSPKLKILVKNIFAFFLEMKRHIKHRIKIFILQSPFLLKIVKKIIRLSKPFGFFNKYNKYLDEKKKKPKKLTELNSIILMKEINSYKKKSDSVIFIGEKDGK